MTDPPLKEVKVEAPEDEWNYRIAREFEGLEYEGITFSSEKEKMNQQQKHFQTPVEPLLAPIVPANPFSDFSQVVSAQMVPELAPNPTQMDAVDLLHQTGPYKDLTKGQFLDIMRVELFSKARNAGILPMGPMMPQLGPQVPLITNISQIPQYQQLFNIAQCSSNPFYTVPAPQLQYIPQCQKFAQNAARLPNFTICDKLSLDNLVETLKTPVLPGTESHIGNEVNRLFHKMFGTTADGQIDWGSKVRTAREQINCMPINTLPTNFATPEAPMSWPDLMSRRQQLEQMYPQVSSVASTVDYSALLKRMSTARNDTASRSPSSSDKAREESAEEEQYEGDNSVSSAEYEISPSLPEFLAQELNAKKKAENNQLVQVQADIPVAQQKKPSAQKVQRTVTHKVHVHFNSGPMISDAEGEDLMFLEFTEGTYTPSARQLRRKRERAIARKNRVKLSGKKVQNENKQSKLICIPTFPKNLQTF